MTDYPGRREFAALSSRIMAASGSRDLIWGDDSVRDPESRCIWLKQASWGQEGITLERLYLVSPDGEVLAGGQRHSEYRIYTEIMAVRPDVGGVVHVHNRHSVALASAGVELRRVSHEANYFATLEVPRFTETADLVLTAELGKLVAAALGRAGALFLVNNGVAVVGLDFQTATVAAVILDRACRQQLLTQGYAGNPSWSATEESLAKRDHIYSQAALVQAWDYLVGQLPSQSEPA